jgi:hypothetical protein
LAKAEIAQNRPSFGEDGRPRQTIAQEFAAIAPLLAVDRSSSVEQRSPQLGFPLGDRLR